MLIRVGSSPTTSTNIAEWSSWLARQPHKLNVMGSSPISASKYGSVVQLAETTGLSPVKCRVRIPPDLPYAGVTQLADVAVSKTAYFGFESHRRHHKRLSDAIGSVQCHDTILLLICEKVKKTHELT